MAKRGRLGAPKNGPSQGSSGAPWLVVVLLVGLVGGLGGFLVSQSGNPSGAAQQTPLPTTPRPDGRPHCRFCFDKGRIICTTCSGTTKRQDGIGGTCPKCAGRGSEACVHPDQKR